MRPKQRETTGSSDLFRARLDQIINMKHELVQLAGSLDWEWLDREIAPLYSDKGRPGIESRFVIGLLLLKHIYALSDEAVCERWVNDPDFQYFTGEEFFQHAFPHERSDLSHWRKRIGEKLELLLAESLRIAHEAGALRGKDLARVTVDTTVQPKAISFPTDAKLLHAHNATNRREAADFEVPSPAATGRSPSGSRTARLSLRVDTLISIRFMAQRPSQSSACAAVQLGSVNSWPS
jgi:IS5 family transposase